MDQPVRFLATDPLDQVYAITSGNELQQYSRTGKLLYTYQNFRHGDLGWVDASNPLNILLFYPAFGEVIVLDRTLSEVALLNLPEFGLWDVPAIGRSGDNQIWLYDPVQTLIRKINMKGEFLVEGQPLSLLLPASPQPEWIVEREQKVYLYDPNLGVLVFDVFGQFLKTIPTPGMEGLRVGNEQWSYLKDGAFFIYAPMAQQSYPLTLPEPAVAVFFQGNRLVLQTETGFAVYAIQ
ncbi:MAG: hypothetical protein H6563_16370 [Lewinellaceae bacterium]|nr:hypothetical protein [Lewinellaceae bacterium]